VNAGLGYGALAPSANGNVFGPNGIVPFARGGIVDRPTVFPFANGGVGLMGEAGPEAIMPLARSPGGKLGVQANGGGGARVINIVSTYKIDGAVSKEEIAREIRRSHAAAVNDAVTIAAAGAPARNMRFNQLGT
jgi:phage-related minor tail protein